MKYQRHKIMYEIDVATNLGELSARVERIKFDALLDKLRNTILEESPISTLGNINITISTDFFIVKGIVKNPDIGSIAKQKGVDINNIIKNSIEKYGKKKIRFGAHLTHLFQSLTIKFAKNKLDEIYSDNLPKVSQVVSNIVESGQAALSKEGINLEIKKITVM